MIVAQPMHRASRVFPAIAGLPMGALGSLAAQWRMMMVVERRGVNDRFGAWKSTLLLFLLAGGGCGSDHPFDLVPVTGRITYEDGTPLPIDGTLRLTFYSDTPPVDEKFRPRPGTAFPDAEGNFSKAMTWRPGDGLITGTHHVTVGYMGRDTSGIVPDEYTLKGETPVIVDTSQQPFEIKIPQP